jgi:ABC-type transport system involved in multi-copper enzyme maturation permease subunit
MRSIFLVARTIFTEALRRREIYVIVLATLAVILAAGFGRFFRLEHLHKFYTEIALKGMSVATVVTVVVLGARQLPREFERRTIYPLLAKPVGRFAFLAGKYIGVVAAGLFCLALFMAVFALCALVMRMPLGWALFAEYIYLQFLLIAVMAALSFLLSMVMGLDAAITVSLLIYLLGNVLTNALTVIYDYLGAAGRAVLIALNYCVPQPAMLDLSAKVIHGWEPVPMRILGLATLYALMFIVPYLGTSYLLLRRRPL